MGNNGDGVGSRQARSRQQALHPRAGAPTGHRGWIAGEGSVPATIGGFCAGGEGEVAFRIPAAAVHVQFW